MGDNLRYELVDQLASGFGALLEQIQDLDKENANLEHLLNRIQEQTRGCNCTSSIERDLHTSSTTAQQNSSDKSGLHIECEDIQLHMNNVPLDTKWLIADGFKAWNALRSDTRSQRPSTSRLMAGNSKILKIPEYSNPSMVKNDMPRCPFTAPQPTTPNPHAASFSQDNSLSQDHALANGIPKDPIAAENHAADTSSLTASQTGSASKCPIRFLDQHSPEEVAEYFRNHRHEIPRSHEICVKRYQKNEDQIRQLDHKYGSLVNMIQGLGQKHQPMLHGKNGAEEVSDGTRTSQILKVEEWAHDVDSDEHKVHKIKPEPEAEQTGEERVAHFDRPLKEIRVGESPSRPWGISVPLGAHVPASAASHHEKPRLATSHRAEPPTPPTASPVQRETKDTFNTAEAGERQPSMLFTGPVFIGYAPDQIADILQRTGLGKGQ
ncbi:MAG: hypothetical protein Q9209_007955 [Squamulea sp. 1 TL-2023]